MTLINEFNKEAYIRHYATHFNEPIMDVRSLVDKNPQILEEYAEYVENRGDFE